MKFSFSPSSTDLEKVEEGTQLLLGDIKSEKELEIQVEFQENVPLTIARNGDHLHITCQEPAHYYRGLNWAVHHPEDTWNTKSEPVYFSKNGVMLDCSRNAVFTVEKVKSFIRIMAKLGMNTLMLYTEETYTVPDEPYFGAYRGRYSQDEIREMDAYARTFGIELVPCIQTLAHLHNALKWPLGETVKDTADILQVGKEEVYTLIEKMLCSVKESFSTNRVHLGMDEAAQLGLGKYLRENGYTKSSVLIREHSARVFEICKKLEQDKILFIPDPNLGHYVAEKLPEKTFAFYKGGCPRHIVVSAKDVEKARAAHPDALFLVHPECRQEVVEQADYVGSTTGIMEFAKKSEHKEFIIGTENSIVEHLQFECPDKKFYPVAVQLTCMNMKVTTLMDIYNCLKGQGGEEIFLPENIMEGAGRCIHRMVELGG